MNNTIKLMVDGVCIEDEAMVAETFNNYFIEKINDLKEGIDPFEKLAAKMKNNKSKFALKRISLNKLTKIMEKLKKKKSAGIDGLGQDQLIMGSHILAAPKTCVSDAIKLWNLAPESIKNSATLHSLKKKTKEFVKTLPI